MNYLPDDDFEEFTIDLDGVEFCPYVTMGLMIICGAPEGVKCEQCSHYEKEEIC